MIRHINETYLEYAKEHLNLHQAKTTIQQRGMYVETVFACEKKDLGLNRAKFRGLMSVHIQSLLTASCYNLKKLLQYSKGFTEKLKTVTDLPILPLSEANMVRLDQKMQSIRPTWSILNLKDYISLFFKHILGLKLAYNVT